jgi:hypothetical protein
VGPLAVGDVAPSVPGISFDDGPVGVLFYKVTCSTSQLAAPTVRAFAEHAPGRVLGIGQDPVPKLERFTDEYDMGIASIEDPPPYALSDAYGIEAVPTLFLIGAEGRVLDRQVGWDREGFNRIADALARSNGVPSFVVSTPDDGLPVSKPG